MRISDWSSDVCSSDLGTLLGTVATVVAVIAVATVGFMMLTGRINWRYGATVILGCFILFGAASIVAGIQSTASLARRSEEHTSELQSLMRISYAVFCLKKKTIDTHELQTTNIALYYF